jgi:hypothetical protein
MKRPGLEKKIIQTNKKIIRNQKAINQTFSIEY